MEDTVFVDELQRVYHADKILGRGGQGVVYRTKTADVAIKLKTENDEPVTDQHKITQFHNKINNLKLLPIPYGINIVMPVFFLKDKAGYVMRLLDGMLPFENLRYESKYKTELEKEFAGVSSWLPVNEPEYASTVCNILWYRKTGGLRKRLSALYQCACILSQLHSNGIYYADLSFKNIFVSESPEDAEVWFIDADNLMLDCIKGNTSAIYTDGFAAPEFFLKNSGNTILSDCYSFAVLAFTLLLTINPFEGPLAFANDDSWDCSEDTVSFKEKRDCGEIPWVFDTQDDSNAIDFNACLQVLNEDLFALFRQSFESGKLNPEQRPTMVHWCYALLKSLHLTVKCRICGMIYYLDDEEKTCPYCGETQNEYLTATSYYADRQGEKTDTVAWKYAVEFYENKLYVLPSALFNIVSFKAVQERYVGIELKQHTFLIENLESYGDCILEYKLADGIGYTAVYSRIVLNKEKLAAGIILKFKNKLETRYIRFALR